MDFTKDSDPGGVKALLAQLRSSQAFQQVSKANADVPRWQAETVVDGMPHHAPLVEQERTSQSPVAALLARLRPSGPHVAAEGSDLGRIERSEKSVEKEEEQARVSPAKRDYRHMTVQQALPQLYELSGDPGFLSTFKKMKGDQDRLEQKLWDERAMLVRKHEEKLKNARGKAALIRASGSLLQEETKLKQAMEMELTAFYERTVLPEWDDLVERQQDTLEKLYVPTMFRTGVETDRSRQQRIVEMLEGIVAEGDGE